MPERSFENLHLRTATRKQAAPMVMVWAAADGRSLFIFLDRNAKINEIIYREAVLETVLKPWVDKNFGRRPWTFQQDSGPSHKACVNQEWSINNVPHFISSTELLANCPDANPLGFSVWGILRRRILLPGSFGS